MTDAVKVEKAADPEPLVGVRDRGALESRPRESTDVEKLR
jgi:hypothetical protein